jgi:hypothetical protein
MTETWLEKEQEHEQNSKKKKRGLKKGLVTKTRIEAENTGT